VKVNMPRFHRGIGRDIEIKRPARPDDDPTVNRAAEAESPPPPPRTGDVTAIGDPSDPTPLAESYIDPEKVRAARQARDVRYHTRQVPALRLLGMVLLSVLLWLHDRFAPADLPRFPGGGYGLALLGYALSSWLVLDRAYARVSAINLGTLFLGIDVLWFAGAVFASGGSHSWLFFILLIRVADQTATTLRNVLVFAHLSVASYALVLAAQRAFTSHPFDWKVELCKLVSIYLASLYIASTSRTVEFLRRRGTRAIHDARILIAQLRAQTDVLDRARAQAEELGRAKGEFFANLSHELRTPLAAGIGLVDLVLESDLTPEQREYLGSVSSSSRTLQVILDQMLDLARLESNSLAMASVAIDVARIAEEAIELVAPAAAAKGLTVDRSIEGPLPAGVRGDPVRLQQILVNLLGNAVKFTERGVVSLRVAAAACDADRVAFDFTIADTGIGIAPALQGTIFDLKQLDASSTRRHGGLGLGLAVTSRLVRAMGGQMSLESAPGAGTTFHVAVPLQVGGAAGPARPPARLAINAGGD
jgi:signal transduction histidine kinase